MQGMRSATGPDTVTGPQNRTGSLLMAIKPSDLPPEIREKLKLPTTKGARKKPSRALLPRTGSLTCHTCGLVFPPGVSDAKAEAHVNQEHGGGRLECEIRQVDQ
jgi:hypothetical protein